MKDEALRLALEALESTGENNGYHGVTQYFDETMVDQAISAIKAALETKDEPAAWMNKYGACKTSLFRDVEAGAKEEYTIPLYTTPPQRKPLTVEEIEALAKKHIAVGTRSFEEFARRIEAAHGIKDNT